MILYWHVAGPGYKIYKVTIMLLVNNNNCTRCNKRTWFELVFKDKSSLLWNLTCSEYEFCFIQDANGTLLATLTLACVASVSLGFPHKLRREQKKKEGFFWSHLNFSAKISKHWNLHGNHTETLATQATLTLFWRIMASSLVRNQPTFVL